MKTNSSNSNRMDPAEDTMHTVSLTESTGSVPTPPTSESAAQSYSEVSGAPAPDTQSGTKTSTSKNIPTHAYVNPDTCIGCGVCEGMCPDVFEMADDGLAHAITAPVPEHLIAEAESARFACPVSAIDVKADDE